MSIDLEEENFMTPRSKAKNKIFIEREENEIENSLKSCCGGSTDRRLVLLISQVSFSTLILIFCGLMMALKEEEDKSVYMSLISSILSFWLGVNISNENKK
jgi:hypothetical protein